MAPSERSVFARVWSSALLFVIVVFAPVAALSTSGTVDDYGALSGRVWSLRADGRYEEAAAAADSLLALVRSSDDLPDYLVPVAEHLSETARRAAGLAEDDRRALATADSLLRFSRSTDDHEAGAEACERQLGVRRRLLGSDHPEVAESLGSLAGHLHAQGRHAAAESLHVAAYKIEHRAWGEEHPYAVGSLMGIGAAKYDQGDHAAADSIYARVHEVRKRVLGEADPATLMALGSLGWSRRELRKHADVARVFLEVVGLKRRALGVDHEEVLADLDQLSGVIMDAIWELRKEGRYAEAVPFADTLALYEASTPGFFANEAAKGRWLAVAVRIGAALPQDERRAFAVADSLIDFILETEDHAAATEALERQLETRRRVLGDEHPDVAWSLIELGYRTWDLGDYVRSEAARSEAVRVALAAFGEKSDVTAHYIGDLSECYQWMEEYDKADSLSQRAYEITRGLYGDRHSATLWRLSLLGWLKMDMGDYAEAERLLRQALEGQREVLGERHAATAMTMNNLGLLLQWLNRYEESEELYRKALEVRTRVFGEVSIPAAITTHGYAALRSMRGDLVTAERLYRKAAGIYQELWHPDHPRIAEVTGDLASCLLRLGRYGEVETICHEIIERWPEHRGYLATAYDILGSCALNRGDPARAEEYIRQTLRIQEEIHGPDHPRVGSYTQTLANRMTARGNLVAAEAMTREALARKRSGYGERHYTVAYSLQALAEIHMQRGDYDQAEAEIREAHEILLDVYGSESSRVGWSLSWLAKISRLRGDNEEAAELAEESLQMIRGALGDDHPSVAGAVDALARMCIIQHEYAVGESLLLEALDIRKRTLGERNTAIAANLRRLGICAMHRGSHVEADSLVATSLNMLKEFLGERHREVGRTALTLGSVRLFAGDPVGAERLYNEAASIHDEIRLMAGTGLERAAAAGWSPYGWLALTQLAQGKGDEAWHSAERISARSLADLLAEADRRDLSPAEEAREDSLRALIAGLEQRVEAYVKSAEVDSTAVSRTEIAAARGELAEAEAAWSSFRYEMAELHPKSEGRPLTLAEVQAALDPETALLGWLDMKKDDGAREAWAYVVRDRGSVTWSKLHGFEDEGGPSPEDVRAIRDAIAGPWTSVAGVRRDARMLWREWIAPVGEALAGVTDLVVIPSGRLLGVPVEALVDDEGRYLREKYRVSYAPSATVYARLGGGTLARAYPGRSLFIGDPPFAETHVAEMASEEGSAWELLASAGGTVVDTLVLRSAATGNVNALASLPRLRGTRAEVMLLEETAPGATVLVGPDASEREIVSMSQRDVLAEFGTIHIATHALVNNEDATQSALVLSQVGLPDPIEAALAGERIYDGLLTAQEIVAECELDADLVTLSACETGLGKKMVGEGYVGFAHAFLEAGARSLVVSLWKVEDRATALLMQRFYEDYSGRYEGERAGYVGEPIPKAAALAEAKEWLRSYEDERGRRPYEHPYYWSAFILIGARE